MANSRKRTESSWIEDARREKEFEEDLLVCRLIVLKIVRYMKDHHLSQKEMAEKLNVSPQYINKFLHGQDLDMKVSTVIRYGRILGIKLLEVPGKNQIETIWSKYGSIQVKMDAVQPICFDYIGLPGEVLNIPSFYYKGVNRSSRPVS